MADIREHIDNDHVISVLEKLIETNRDAQEGFRDAAEHIKDPEVRNLFNRISTARAEFAGELENEVIRLGKHNPNRTATTGGALHRRWIDLKAALGGGDHSILSSVESGEDSAKKAYAEALQEKLPQDIHDILRRQSQEVISSHDQVRALRDKKAA
ncbi:MAG: ferritin-like domain-containing protein [Acidobacteriaceae bacterium]